MKNNLLYVNALGVFLTKSTSIQPGLASEDGTNIDGEATPSSLERSTSTSEQTTKFLGKTHVF